MCQQFSPEPIRVKIFLPAEDSLITDNEISKIVYFRKEKQYFTWYTLLRDYKL